MNKKPLFAISLEKNPLDDPADFKVDIESQPIEIVIVRTVLERILQFFAQTKQFDLHAIEAAAFEKLENIKK